MTVKIPHIERPDPEEYTRPLQKTAKNALRITTEGRTFLPDVIPLSTPYLVFLDPSDLCNAKCGWCPTGTGEIKKYRKQQLMDFVLYRKVIDNLCAMPEPIKTLRLYCFGEPLLNPMFAEMVKYAKKTGRFGQIDTTSNGLLLNEKLSMRLADSGIDKIFISVPADYSAEYLANIAFLHGYSLYREGRNPHKVHIHVKIIGGDPGSEKQFYEDFVYISDSLSIEYLSPCWPGFTVDAGAKGIYGQPLPLEAPDVCSYLFYSLAINSDGTVSACFLDYQHDMILGDLKNESFKDIWNGEKLYRRRMEQLRGLRCGVKHCGDCQQLRYGAPDNIDAYAGIIWEKLTEDEK